MDLRAILSRQATQTKIGSSSRAVPPPVIQAEQPARRPNSPALSSASAATPPDSTAVGRKRKRPLIPTPEVVVLPSTQTEGGKSQYPGEPSSARSPVSPPQYPREYEAETNLFTAGPSSLGFNILHSLGSAAEQEYLASCKLKTCTLEGCNDLIRVRAIFFQVTLFQFYPA